MMSDRLELKPIPNVVNVNDIQNIIDTNIILQERIDKAIEYIENNSEMTDIHIYGIENVLAFRGSCSKLLEILKGEE